MNEFPIQADASQLRALQRAFAAAPDIATAELLRFFTEVANHLQSEVQALTPKAHGLLRNSIVGEARLDGLGVEAVVGSSMAYAEPVELGTKPHTPPLEPLIDWVLQKLPVGQAYSIRTHLRMGGKAERASQNAEAEAVARKIQRKIAAHGTPAVGMFHRAWAANKAQIASQFGETVQRILTRMAEAD